MSSKIWKVLDSDERQRVGRICINPLTALEFVSSSTDVYSFVVETIANSLSGSFWTQLDVKKFALTHTSDFASVILNF
jgi:hypothetical protein